MEPGQKVHECLKAEFSEEALGSLVQDDKHKEMLRKQLDEIFASGTEVNL